MRLYVVFCNWFLIACPLHRPIKPFVKHFETGAPHCQVCSSTETRPRYRKAMADPNAATVGTRPLLRFLEPWENASTSDFALEQAKLKWGGSFGLEYMRAIDALRR